MDSSFRPLLMPFLVVSPQRLLEERPPTKDDMTASSATVPGTTEGRKHPDIAISILNLEDGKTGASLKSSQSGRDEVGDSSEGEEYGRESNDQDDSEEDDSLPRNQLPTSKEDPMGSGRIPDITRPREAEEIAQNAKRRQRSGRSSLGHFEIGRPAHRASDCMFRTPFMLDQNSCPPISPITTARTRLPLIG